jgi:hypothetical protein
MNISTDEINQNVRMLKQYIPEPDIKAALVAYIKHIKKCEGVTFLEDEYLHDFGGHQLTPEQLDILRDASKENQP